MEEDAFKVLKEDASIGSYNLSIGNYAGANLTIGNNNIFIGDYAGYDFVGESNIVIIGDNIRNLNSDHNNNVLFFSKRVAIGKTLFGKPCNLQEVIKSFIRKAGVICFQ